MLFGTIYWYSQLKNFNHINCSERVKQFKLSLFFNLFVVLSLRRVAAAVCFGDQGRFVRGSPGIGVILVAGKIGLIKKFPFAVHLDNLELW